MKRSIAFLLLSFLVLTSCDTGTAGQATPTPESTAAPGTTAGPGTTTGSITGTYSSSAGVLSSSRVTLYDSNKAYKSSNRTDSQGKFAFSDLSAGTYYLKFTKSGSPDIWYDNKSNADATPVIVTVNTVMTVDFMYPAGYTLHGTCTNPDSSLLTITNIELYDSGKNKVAYDYSDFSSGEYMFSDLPAGTYYIVVDKDSTYPMWYDGKVKSTATQISLTGDTLLDLQYKAPGTASISGTVKDNGNAALPTARISLYSTSDKYSTIFTVKAAADGSYSLPGLPEDTYYVEYFYSQNSPGVWHGGTTPASISIGTGASQTLDFTYPDKGSISGTLKNASGDALTFTWIDLYAVDGRVILSRMSGNDGSFLFEGLPAGTYYLSEGISTVVWYGNATKMENSTPISIAVNESKTGINFQLAN